MENMDYVYILWSESTLKFYTGRTNNLVRRLEQHQNGFNTSTKVGSPWKLVWNSQGMTLREASLLEKKIKKRGAKRFLLDAGENVR